MRNFIDLVESLSRSSDAEEVVTVKIFTTEDHRDDVVDIVTKMEVRWNEKERAKSFEKVQIIAECPRVRAEALVRSLKMSRIPDTTFNII